MSHHTQPVCGQPLRAVRSERRVRASSGGRPVRLGLVGLLSVAVSLLFAPAALAKFSLKALHLGSASGAADYLFASGNTVVEQCQVDRGRYYRFDVYDPSGTVRLTTSCRPTPGNGQAAAAYALQSADPLSSTNAWRFRLREFTSSANCSGASSARHDGS